MRNPSVEFRKKCNTADVIWLNKLVILIMNNLLSLFQSLEFDSNDTQLVFYYDKYAMYHKFGNCLIVFNKNLTFQVYYEHTGRKRLSCMFLKTTFGKLSNLFVSYEIIALFQIGIGSSWSDFTLMIAISTQFDTSMISPTLSPWVLYEPVVTMIESTGAEYIIVDTVWVELNVNGIHCYVNWTNSGWK